MNPIAVAAKPRSNSLHALAATLGTTVAIVVGASVGIALARVIGIEQSIADYGSAFRLVVSSAWLFGILGCYIGLRALRDPRALLTALVLAPVLAATPLLIATAGQAGGGGGWDFGGLVVAMIVEVGLPVASPGIAYFLAGLGSNT